jgi:hypothetical protein
MRTTRFTRSPTMPCAEMRMLKERHHARTHTTRSHNTNVTYAVRQENKHAACKPMDWGRSDQRHTQKTAEA